MEKVYTLMEEQLRAFSVKYVTDPANIASLLATLPTTQAPVVPSADELETIWKGAYLSAKSFNPSEMFGGKKWRRAGYDAIHAHLLTLTHQQPSGVDES